MNGGSIITNGHNNCEDLFTGSPLIIYPFPYIDIEEVTMKQVSTRISEEDEAILAKFESETGTNRSEALRRLIRQGLSEWRQENALQKLRNHTTTVRKAAEFASVPYVEMVQIAADEGIDIGYTIEDLERDLEKI